jgi:hypothetical protein
MYDGSFLNSFKKPLYDMLAKIKCWSDELTVAKSISMLGFVFTNSVLFFVHVRNQSIYFELT